MSFSVSKSKKKAYLKLYHKTLKKTSYVDVYKLEINDNFKAVATYAGTYKLTAGSKGKRIKLKKKKIKGNCTKFEMEDIYINKSTGVMYFNSEGSDEYHDILGNMKLK